MHDEQKQFDPGAVTQMRAPGGRTALLHQVFRESARRFANHVAIEAPGAAGRPSATFTYAQIDRLSDGLAGRLRPLIQGECVVAILLPRRSPLPYVAQLGVMKAGAAYTCLDPAMPAEHLKFVLDDCGAAAVITAAEHRALVAELGYPAGRVIEFGAVDDGSVEPATTAPPWLGPSLLCYVIYTSGTTGRPKGVMVEHHSIVNLVQSDVEYFQLTPADRVAQSSSIAYDSSIEEIWLALAAGATLVVMDDDVVRLGPDLAPWLREQRITVFCPPPTLLRMCSCEDPQRELPDLRLLYVGGEQLTADVLERWGPGRWLENGYGPTECTVTCTRTRVQPGRPVTIGRPVSNNSVIILDGEFREVADGAVGELCIAGEGVARGYLNRPELTAEKFLEHPVHGRMYRTGDLVRQLACGDLEFLGRADTQVKIRGHRVELGEIEARLCECDGVLAAACKVQGAGESQQLVAFLVARPGAQLDIETIRKALRAKLPGHMQPAHYALIEQLPTAASSGKLDRKALPDIHAEKAPGRQVVAARSDIERLVVAAFAARFEDLGAVSIHDDFFLDLGGNSLLAAQTISALRKNPATAMLTVRDLYEARTATLLAARARAAPPGGGEEVLRETPHAAAITPSRVAAALAVQIPVIALMVGVASAAGYWVVFALLPALAQWMGGGVFLVAAPWLLAAGRIAWFAPSLLMAVAAKKVLIGRYRAGRYPYLGSLYLRHWIVQQLVRAVPWGVVEGTIFKNAGLRALGARIGRNVHIHTGVDLREGGWDLLEIGDDVTLGREASLGLVDYDRQQLVLAPVRIGNRCTLDTRARMAGHSSMGDDACLTSLSMLPAHGAIPAGELWDGVPAGYRAPSPPAAAPEDRPMSPAAHGALLMLVRSVVGGLGLLPVFLLALLAVSAGGLDSGGLIDYLNGIRVLSVVEVLLVVVLGYALSSPMQALQVRLLGKVRPGVYSRWGWKFIAIYLKGRIVEQAGEALSGTLFWPAWLRLAGMRVGRKCEISTIMEVVPELIDVGEECFFADGIYLGRPWLHRGTITCAPTRFSRNTFLGNHVVVPAGAELPAEILLGVSSVADAQRIRPGTSWFGHPLFELPRREVVSSDRRLTFDPDWYRWVTRVFWEMLRVCIPVLPALLALGWFELALRWQATLSAGALYGLALPLYTVCASAALCVAVLACKWILLGRVRPGQHALWSCWCSRWDFLYVLWAGYARSLLGLLQGTPLLAWWLRAMGVGVGRRVVFGADFTQVVDPDMLRFEDDATVSCQFQAHSFEDRVLKIDAVRLEAGSTSGHGAVLFYGAVVGAGATVADNSVVMKHEMLLPGRYHIGCPTRPGIDPQSA